jgi:hypothetical protein
VTYPRMATIVEGMSLQALLRQYGITRPIELARAIGVDRRYASLIWTGKRRLGAKLAMKLWREKGVPIHEALEASVEPVPTPRGRPRKRPPEEDQP